MTYRILFTILHAVLWAAKDAGDIRAGKPIEHGFRWFMRAVIEVVASVAFALGIGQRPIDLHLAALTIACAFLFSAVFRFALNTMRGREWRYTSKSSMYDTAFNELTYLLWNKAGKGLLQFRHYRAGLLAYLFELLVFALLIFL